MNSNKKISVIIPIYNAEAFLEKLFQCFDKCDFHPNDEIILIDNNSTDRTNQICEDKCKERPDLYRLFKYTLKADSYASRNFAVSKANGDILAFTDSDCMPTPQWLDNVRDSFCSGQIMAGDVQLEILNNGIWECFDAITHLSQSKEHISKNCVATANMAVYREDFEKIGPFEERFAGGDFEWSQRASKMGYEIVYCSDALIFHPSRKSYKEIETRERRGAYGAGKAQKINGDALLPLVVKYVLRIFKIDTYIKSTYKLKKRGIACKDLLYFNLSFFKIRVSQVKSVIDGYRGQDARKIGVK